MARKLKISGYKGDDGKLHFPSRGKIIPFAERLAPGTVVFLEIAEDESQHVKSHKGYYFAVVVRECGQALRDVCGYPIDPVKDSDAVHEWLKKEFLHNWKKVKNMDGEEITLPPSTTRLDDEGWKDYLRKIITFAAEMWGYEIPRKTSKYFFPMEEPGRLAG